MTEIKTLEPMITTVTLDGIISPSAIESIELFLYDRLITLNWKDEIGTNWVGPRGTFPKRMARFLKKNGYKLSGDDISKIGKIARDSCNGHPEEFQFIVTRDIDWSPGDYGDYNSCFWSCRKNAKDIILDGGGYALLLHSMKDNPLSRCWAVPYKEYWVVFNCYALDGLPYSLITFARILSDYLGAPYYRNVELLNNGQAEATLWINNSKGYIIGSLSCQKISDVDFCIEDPYAKFCYRCDEFTTDAVEGPDGHWYCRSCFHSRFGECHECGTPLRLDAEAYYYDVGSRPFCEKCWHENMAECDHCESTFFDDDVTFLHNGERICPRCAVNTFTCGECGEIHWSKNGFRTYLKDRGYVPICKSCYNQLLIYECDYCGLHTDMSAYINTSPHVRTACMGCWNEWEYRNLEYIRFKAQESRARQRIKQQKERKRNSSYKMYWDEPEWTTTSETWGYTTG